MPVDLVCGQCQGRLLAEEPGSVVACPHCGTHLHVPDVAVVEGPLPAPETVSPLMAPQSQVGIIGLAAMTSSLEVADAAPLEQTAIVHVDQSLLIEETTTSAALPEATPLSELPSHSTPRMPIEASAYAEAPPLAAPSAESPPAPQPPGPQPAAPASPAAEGPEMPVMAAAGPTEVATVPRFWFLIVASYASAVTLAFLFLLLTLGRMKTHPLESLPDVVPKIQKGEVALEVAPPDANVAPGHVLSLGETRRFGNLNVTPLRVTEGPLRFEHVLNASAADRPPSDPVLKLWLKFENVSRNQSFMPLDALLLFKRYYQEFGKPVLTNQFLCQKSERRRGGILHYVYELSATSEYRIVGQNLDRELGPGQSVEIFIPSEELIDDLTGDLVWRVQFRKGYHPRTFHGVTTLIDVPFNRSDVKNDT
jgi:hypothetical protein